MNENPLITGPFSPPSLLSAATKWTALLPYLDARFKASVDYSNMGGTAGMLKVELVPTEAPIGCAKVQSLLQSPSLLGVEYRRAQRHWYNQIMQWASKHDTILKLAADVGFEMSVRDLVFRSDLVVDDRRTALNFVTFQHRGGSYPPEELRLTMAALHCIDEYFMLESKGSKLSSERRLKQVSKFIVTMYHLWEGGALPQEKRKWFRKLAHKGFFDICHKILKERDLHPRIATETFKPAVNELLIIYVHSLSRDPDHPILRMVEERRDWTKQLIAQTISRSLLHRLANRPTLFSAALNFVWKYYPDGLKTVFRDKVDRQTIILACENYNVAFLQAVLRFKDIPGLCHMLHPTLVKLAGQQSGAALLSCMYDTLSSASPDLWSRLVTMETFQLFQIASGKGFAQHCQIILEGCLPEPEILKTMILAAKSRREFCQSFVTLCAENGTDLLDVYRKYFPFDLWDDMTSYESFSGPCKAALAGHVQVLEIIRQGYRQVKRESWHSLLSQLLNPKILNQCSISMGHYLYFEQDLRPHLEHEALLWQAIRRNEHLESVETLRVPPVSTVSSSSSLATASTSDEDR